MKKNDMIMSKEQLVKTILTYNGYVMSVNNHVAPTKGINSGSHGRLYEMLIKLSLANYRFKGVSKQGMADTRKKIDGIMSDFEIKCNAGELIKYNLTTETIVSDIRDCKYFIYSPDYIPVITDDCDIAIKNAVKQSYILESEVFWQEACKNGLIRIKKSTAWYSKSNFSNLCFDRVTIGNLSQSNRKMNLMYNLLESNASELEPWLYEKGIWKK